MQFNDKVVIVTGGAQGIGKCIADDLSCRTWLDVERVIDRNK